MAVQDWDDDHTLNTSLEGIDCGEGTMLPPSINDLFRKMAAAIRTYYDKSYRKGETIKNQAVGGALPVTAEENDILIEYTP